MWNEYSVLNDYSELYLEAAIAFVRDRGAPLEAVARLSRPMSPECAELRGGYIRGNDAQAYADLVDTLAEPGAGHKLEALGVAKRIGNWLIPLDVPRLLAKRARGSLDRAVANFQTDLRSAMRHAPPRWPDLVASGSCSGEPLCHKLLYDGMPYELIPAEGPRDEEYRFWITWALWRARGYGVYEAYREAQALYASGVVRGPYAEWLGQAPRRAQWLTLLALAAASQSYPEARGTEEDYLKALYEQARKRG